MSYKTLCLLIVLIITGFYCLRDVPVDKRDEVSTQFKQKDIQTKVVKNGDKLPQANKTAQSADVLIGTEDSKPVVLFFYTDWCRGCKMFKPTYYAVKNRVVGYRYVEINADKNDKLSRHFNIRSIPTVYIYDKKNNYKGKVNINNFERELRNYLDKRSK